MVVHSTKNPDILCIRNARIFSQPIFTLLKCGYFVFGIVIDNPSDSNWVSFHVKRFSTYPNVSTLVGPIIRCKANKS